MSSAVETTPANDDAGGPSSRGRLARDSGAGFGLNVVNLGASILASVVLARTMAVSEFGLYSWAVAVVTLLTVPAVLGADRLLVRDVAAYLVRDARGLVRGLIRRVAAIVLVMSGAIAIALAVGAMLVLPATDVTRLVLIVAVVSLPLLGLAKVAQSTLIGLHQVILGQIPELFLRPIVFLILAALAAAALGPRLDAALAVALYGTAAGVGLAVAAVLLRRAMGRHVGDVSPQYQTRQWAIAATGLVVLSGGLVINSQTGIVLLGIIDVPASAGIYAVAQRGALLVSFPLIALNAALAPTAARLWTSGRVDDLQHLVASGTRGVVLAALPIALIFIVGGATLLGLVFGDQFVAGADALAILSLGQLANAATGSVATLLIMTGNQWRAAIGLAAGIIVNVGLGLLLIPSMHATGAAIAAASSLVVSNVIHVVIARRATGIDSTILGLRVRHSNG